MFRAHEDGRRRKRAAQTAESAKGAQGFARVANFQNGQVTVWVQSTGGASAGSCVSVVADRHSPFQVVPMRRFQDLFAIGSCQIPLPNAARAVRFQEERAFTPFPYNEGTRDCLTYAITVLRKGGARVPRNIPSFLHWLETHGEVKGTPNWLGIHAEDIVENEHASDPSSEGRGQPGRNPQR